MDEFFQKYGLKLLMRQQERVFELVKQGDGPFVAYPYALVSDTLRRIIFYTVAMASNKESVLVFEEPESNAFPYYTKYLGERIALDECVGSAGIGQVLSSAKRVDRWADVGMMNWDGAFVKSIGSSFRSCRRFLDSSGGGWSVLSDGPPRAFPRAFEEGP